MRILSKVMEAIGISALFVGGSAIGDIILIPFLIAIGGLGVAYLGWRIDEAYV